LVPLFPGAPCGPGGPWVPVLTGPTVNAPDA